MLEAVDTLVVSPSRKESSEIFRLSCLSSAKASHREPPATNAGARKFGADFWDVRLGCRSVISDRQLLVFKVKETLSLFDCAGTDNLLDLCWEGRQGW